MVESQGMLTGEMQQFYQGFQDAQSNRSCATMEPEPTLRTNFCDDDNRMFMDTGWRAVTPYCAYTCCVVKPNHTAIDGSVSRIVPRYCPSSCSGLSVPND